MQEVGDERQRLRRLGREQRQQPLGLGVHDLAQHRVLGDRAVREREAPLEQLREVGRVAHLVGELVEVVGELPADGLEQQLVAAAGELPVDRRPRDPRLLHDVVDRGLAQPEPLDAPIGRRRAAGRAGVSGSAAWVTARPLWARIDAVTANDETGSKRDAAVVWHGFTQMAAYADNRPIIVEPRPRATS